MIEMAEPDRHNATLDDLVGMALAVYDRAMQGVPATDEHGQPILCDGEPLFAPDLHSANHALETVARLCGFVVERREVTLRTLDGMAGRTAEVVKLEVIEGGNDGDAA